MPKMTITGQEADLLLYAVDAYCKTNARGEVGRGYTHWQKLRDRLMAAHEHPNDEEEELGPEEQF